MDAQERREYWKLWSTVRISAAARARAKAIVRRWTEDAVWQRYHAVESALHDRVPWWLVGILHEMESGGRFDRHLHNGDPLEARTVHVPVGRPARGVPPYTWVDSAIDAIEGYLETLPHGLPLEPSAPGYLRALEAFNGFGYRNLGLPSPYLWAGTAFYVRGKFVADGRWDEDAVSEQLGAAVLLRTFKPGLPAIALGAGYDGREDAVRRLQDAMVAIGWNGRIDGAWGPATQAAVTHFLTNEGDTI